MPGLSGWAQVNGRDEFAIPDKVAFDAYYLEHQSFWWDLQILAITAARVFNREGSGKRQAAAAPARKDDRRAA